MKLVFRSDNLEDNSIERKVEEACALVDTLPDWKTIATVRTLAA